VLAAKGAATVSALGALVVLAFSAAPAAAVVVRLGGHSYGVAPLTAAGAATGAGAGSSLQRARRFDELPGGGSALEYHGGPVMHANNTHVVYWDPGSEFTPTTESIVARFFGDVAHDSGLPSNVFAVDAQYQDGGGSNSAYRATFAGALTDSANYPASGCTPAVTEADPGPPYTHCLTDEQLKSQLLSFIAKQKLPKGPEQLYFVLLPHKVVTCVAEEVCSNNTFCAYHSVISPGTAGEVIYSDIPFSFLDSGAFAGGMIHAKGCQADGNELIQAPNGDTAGTNASTRFGDVAVKYISHEYSESITDPLLDAWFDRNEMEIGDKCNAVPLPEEEEPEPGLDLHAFTPTLGGSPVAGTLFNQVINGGDYYLQSEWDNAAKACLMTPLPLGEGSFAVPSATAGAAVTFTGSAFDPYAGFEPTWTFGDGATASGASPSHTYSTAGEFTVTMTPRDRLTGATGPAVSHTIVVAAAPVAAVAVPPPVAVAAVAPRSAFAAATAVVNPKTGVVTLTTSVLDPGTFSFRATFPNGRFGAFVSSACRKPRIKLSGRCLPATIVYASGSKAFAAAGRVRVTLKPTASALKALKRALRQRHGLRVTLVLRFQSVRGGAAFSRSQSLIVRPRR
jgi:PKD repeat protein